MSALSLYYYVDDKFDVVLKELESLGKNWQRTTDMKKCTSLLWTNLRNVVWEDVSTSDPDLIVSHLRGSQHFSNKSFLAYHMNMAGKGAYMPMQWSAAYQDLAELVGMVLVNTLYGCSLKVERLVAEDNMKPYVSLECDASSLLSTLNECTKVYRALLMDAEWAASVAATCASALLSSISSIINITTKKVGTNPDKLQCAALQARNQAEVQMQCRWSNGDTELWIVKPVGGSCGVDIRLCRGMRNLLAQVASMQYKCVVQKYVERPLLVRGDQRRKFDIRQWVLVTSVDPVVVHGFTECYGRLSGKQFDISSASLADRIVHLCNNAVQATDSSYTDAWTPGALADAEPVCDTMMSHQQLVRDVDSQYGEGTFSLKIVPQMRRAAVDAVFSVRDKLLRVARGFEWLGLDFLVTERLEVLLLECNVSPDLSMSTAVTSRLVTTAVRTVLPLLLDGVQPESAASAQSPHWETWHPCSVVQTETWGFVCPTNDGAADSNNLSVLQFARRKREGAQLRSDYAPLKKAVADRVEALLNSESVENGAPRIVSENEEEDEL